MLAIPGTKPKPDGQKRNRVKPAHDWVEVPEVPFVGGPPLPARRSEGRSWPVRTKRWWKAISRMPHCVLWTEADWEYAIDTAYVAAEFHSGNVRVATELRNREKLLGNTLDSRRDLRIRYVSPGADLAGESATVTAMADYRRMVSD